MDTGRRKGRNHRQGQMEELMFLGLRKMGREFPVLHLRRLLGVQ